MAKICKEVLAN